MTFHDIFIIVTAASGSVLVVGSLIHLAYEEWTYRKEQRNE